LSGKPTAQVQRSHPDRPEIERVVSIGEAEEGGVLERDCDLSRLAQVLLREAGHDLQAARFLATLQLEEQLVAADGRRVFSWQNKKEKKKKKKKKSCLYK
jgi:hypothetical protein